MHLWMLKYCGSGFGSLTILYVKWDLAIQTSLWIPGIFTGCVCIISTWFQVKIRPMKSSANSGSPETTAIGIIFTCLQSTHETTDPCAHSASSVIKATTANLYREIHIIFETLNICVVKEICNNPCSHPASSIQEANIHQKIRDSLITLSI